MPFLPRNGFEAVNEMRQALYAASQRYIQKEKQYFETGCQYKLKRCSNKECCKQCRYVMFKGTMTKWPVQKLAQGTTQKLLKHHDATDI